MVEEVYCEEDDWEYLRQLVRQRAGTKAEDGWDEMGMSGSQIVEVSVDRVLCLQNRISRKLRNGTGLEDLIAQLQAGEVDPMRTNWLVLDMARASWYDRPTNSHITRYYTFDHRRFYCMWQAGFEKIRARIVLENSFFNDFARKADSLWGTALRNTSVFCRF